MNGENPVLTLECKELFALKLEKGDVIDITNSETGSSKLSLYVRDSS